MRLLIVVTRSCIDGAEPGNSCECPVAQAIRRAAIAEIDRRRLAGLPCAREYPDVFVAATVFFNDRITVDLPEDVWDLVVEYDEAPGGPFMPEFGFPLDVPDEVFTGA